MATKPHFSVLATSFAGGPRPRNAALILAGLWLLLFFAALFAPPLLDDADATHAQAAQHIALTGHVVTLQVDGVRYLEKAPLLYWLVALSFKLFGFNTFAAHLPQAIAVALLALLGHRWANHAFGSRTAFYTALALLTSLGIFLFTRILIPEVWLALFLATALYAFLRTVVPPQTQVAHASQPPRDAWAGPEAQLPEHPARIYPLTPYYPYLMWAALALAVLTKGLVALVFFFATTLLYLTLTADLKQIKLLKPLTGPLLFLTIAAPWHIVTALHNPATADHHGFLWFYFWNEHVLRFLGRRTPADYNRLPGYLYWLQHLVWLFPWMLFLPLGFTALWRRFRHQTTTITGHVGHLFSIPRDAIYYQPLPFRGILLISPLLLLIGYLRFNHYLADPEFFSTLPSGACAILAALILSRRARAHLPRSPFHRIDPQQRHILLLSIFAAVILLFFSLSTNQEYYTFPAYLPLLLLISATITRAEQTYSSNPSAQRWITFAHVTFATVGVVIALALLTGLMLSRKIPATTDIGTLLAHRGLGNYTLSTSHLFDLTTPAFAALRLPAALAALAFATGPALAWQLRMQRRHLAATTTIAFTAAAFLFAAHLAFARFAPLLSSLDFVTNIRLLERSRLIPTSTPVYLFGDQSYGSSIPFYLGHPVLLVDGRTTSMQFGSTFPDVPNVFLTQKDLLHDWAQPRPMLLFVPAERREDALKLLPNPTILRDQSGKLLLTNHPLP